MKMTVMIRRRKKATTTMNLAVIRSSSTFIHINIQLEKKRKNLYLLFISFKKPNSSTAIIISQQGRVGKKTMLYKHLGRGRYEKTYAHANAERA